MSQAAGRLRWPIRIERCVGERFDFGLDTSEWVTFRTPWARITPVSGGEATTNDQKQQRITHTVEIRADRGQPVTTDMRIVYGSRILEIARAIDVDELGETLLLECVEVVQ